MVSEAVEIECDRGDPGIVAVRRRLLQEATLFPLNQEILELARVLIAPGAIPAKVGPMNAARSFFRSESDIVVSRNLCKRHLSLVTFSLRSLGSELPIGWQSSLKLPYRYILFDHDSKFNVDVIWLVTATGLHPKRKSIQAPWQNGIAERWIGSCRREMLDYIIPLNERHLRGLLREYASYPMKTVFTMV